MSKIGLQLLEDHTIRACNLQRSELIVLSSNDTIQSAAECLSAHRIHSAPVCAPGTDNCVGFVDFLDLTYCLMKNSTTRNYPDAMARQPLSTVLAAKPFHDEAAMHQWYIPIHDTDTLAKAASFFLKARHVPIAHTGSHKIAWTFSPSCLMSFLMPHFAAGGSLEAIGSKTLSSLNLGIAPVVSLPTSATVATSLQTMRDHNISAVPLVDDNGDIAKVTSAADLWEIFTDMDPRESMNEALEEYINNPHAKAARPITCTANTTFLEALTTMLDRRIHRIYVVKQGTHTPSGVVSLVDMLAAVVSYEA